jgi:hypothetical protein
MRVAFASSAVSDPRILQGTSALREGAEYVVLEVIAPPGRAVKFRVEFSEGQWEQSALFDSRAFRVISHEIPPNWQFFQGEFGEFTLRPEPWNRTGFWESYYDHEPQSLEIYEIERQKILSSS